LFAEFFERQRLANLEAAAAAGANTAAMADLIGNLVRDRETAAAVQHQRRDAESSGLSGAGLADADDPSKVCGIGRNLLLPLRCIICGPFYAAVSFEHFILKYFISFAFWFLLPAARPLSGRRPPPPPLLVP